MVQAETAAGFPVGKEMWDALKIVEHSIAANEVHQLARFAFGFVGGSREIATAAGMARVT